MTRSTSVHGLLFLLFFAANYQRSRSNFLGNPEPTNVQRTKNSKGITITPPFAAVFVRNHENAEGDIIPGKGFSW
jgi:hypothetical protein